MILSAVSLTDMQACVRRPVLSADWEVLRFRPKQLLDACLRKGIMAVSGGEDAAAVARTIRTEFLQAAANPGMETRAGADSFKIAMDSCAVIETVLRAAGRMEVTKLGECGAININPSVAWQPLAFWGADEQMHRFITIDRWTEDDLARELHGWYVVGDMAVTKLPMTLHVIEIGQTRDGRRASAWARGWRHPTMRNAQRIRFLHKDGTTFKGWTPVWLADEKSLDAGEWVEAMWREGAAQRLWHTISVAMPTEAQRAETVRQVLSEAARMSVLISERRSATWRALPMARAACDGIVPCAWQGACYGESDNLASTGLYILREKSILRVA